MDFRQSEVVPIRTQRVPQTIETPVTFVAVPGAYVRFAYARSSDSMANQIEGQDYLCFQHNDQRLVFVVCDGVGSSFCGNLAARILGDRLLEWLWLVEVPRMGGASALIETATSYLQRIQREAQLEVEEYQIPDSISGLVRQALEAQRAYGSEAIFVAGRVDHPSPTIPEGLVSLFWMGDTQVHVLDETGQPFEIGGVWDNVNRWSTVQGPRGRVSAWMRPLSGVGRIVAFTDGLALHAGKLLHYSDDKLDREIRAGARLPSSDDVAFFDLVLRTPRYEGYPDPELPDPLMERPHLGPIWNPTGANIYELRWSWPGQPKARFMIQEASNPALTDAHLIDPVPGELIWRPPTPRPPGHYYYRVRAVNRRGVVTPWSELRQTKVAYPPPPAPRFEPTEPDQAMLLSWSGEGEALDYELEESATPDFAQPTTVYSGRGTSWAVPARSYKPGTYYYRVRAISDGGPGPWSQVRQVQITLPPPPVPNLATVNYQHMYGAYELRWQAVSGASYYELEELHRDTGQSRIIRLDEASYHVEDQKVGEFIYRVRACHDFGCSDWSNEQLVIVAPQAPDQAPELSLEGPDEKDVLTLHWTEVPGASVYVLEVSEEADFRNARVYTQAELSLKMVRREPGESYFRVCGANSGGDGPWSNVEHFSIAPKMPAWIEAELSEDGQRIVLAWGAVGGRVTYRAQMAAASDEDAPYVDVYHGQDTQYTFVLSMRSEALTFRVRAELAHTQSDWQYSDPVYAQPAPAAPKLTPAEIDERGAIHLRWSAIEGTSHYLLEIGRDEQFGGQQAIRVERPKAVFQPPSSGRYWFRVRACRGGQRSVPSNVVSVQSQRPAAPRLWPLDPVKSGTVFEVSWTGVPGSLYYELQLSSSERFEIDRSRSVRVFHPAQKVAIPPQERGRYHFRVRAIDENDRASLWSENLIVEVIDD